MCGIIGYLGPQPALPVLLNGLRRMKYRGYDSAGIAVIAKGKLKIVRCQGSVEDLAARIDEKTFATPTIGIGHTRWATHGNPSERNSHPHFAGDRIAIVHNGIVENYAEIKEELKKDGALFTSDTDSEVLAHLILKEVQNKPLADAVIAALKRVEGTFGLAVLDSETPNEIVVARRGSPLLLGLGDEETYIASDATALVSHTNKVVYLEDDEIAICKAGNYEIRTLENQIREAQTHHLDLKIESIEKGGYDHFLIKEIMEQPKTVTDILRGRLDTQEGISHLGGLNLNETFFRKQKRFLTLGCGTAYYAGLVGKYLLERMTNLPVDVEYGSEFRYREPALSPDTLAVIISQSGETADTLASLHEAKRHGIATVGLVNVVGSTVAREVDGGIYLHAGPEISVASTKAFTAQVIAQLLLGLRIARSRNMSLMEGQEIVTALAALPDQIEAVLKQAPAIRALAKKMAHFDNVMYLGRDSMYPVALEGSHKLKEVSYIHAEAYPAGEMKHGANALIDDDLLVVFLLPQGPLYAKSRSNLEEVRARNGKILALATEGDKEIAGFTKDIISIPEVSQWTLPIIANIPLQLFAYYMAVERGTNVDQPRNLAKSVTVE